MSPTFLSKSHSIRPDSAAARTSSIIHYLVDNFLLGVENFLLNLFEILSQRGLRSSILLRRGLHLARDGLDLSQGVLLAPAGQFKVKKV